MKIDLILYASLTRFVPGSVAGDLIQLEIQPKASVNDVLKQMGLPVDISLILLINGRSGVKSQELHEKDRLAVFPTIAGG
ncbi:MAG: MoaD/ThiS family protein [Desulfomonilaceae bacterium]|jgi:sulfur carrier protein ThiS